MQIDASVENLHVMLNSVFWEKRQMSSAESFA